MKFLNGYKRVIGLTWMLLYAAARVLVEVPACSAALQARLASQGVDMVGGMAVALTILGIVHAWEKRQP